MPLLKRIVFTSAAVLSFSAPSWALSEGGWAHAMAQAHERAGEEFRKKVEAGSLTIHVSADQQGPGAVIAAIRQLRSAEFQSERFIDAQCVEQALNENLSIYSAVGIRAKQVISEVRVVSYAQARLLRNPEQKKKFEIYTAIQWEDPSGRMNPDPMFWFSCEPRGFITPSN